MRFNFPIVVVLVVLIALASWQADQEKRQKTIDWYQAPSPTGAGIE